MDSDKIKITIIENANRHDVYLPIDVAMKRLLPAIITKLNLPRYTQDKNIIEYSVVREDNGQKINENSSIASEGLKENQSVLLVSKVSTSIMPGEKLPIPERELIEAVENTVPIYIPARENLAIGLVPIDLVYRLEEYRSDEMKWDSIFWMLSGSILGILINWVTAENIIINKYSITLLAVFVIMGAITGSARISYQKRAQEVKNKLYSFIEKK